MSHQIGKRHCRWICLYLAALMTFILLHCSTEMLPKQQEGPVCVMMALVKPLIVCIWVELELVIGECAHCQISEPLPRNLALSWGKGKFSFLLGLSVTTFGRFSSEYDFRMAAVIFRADPATRCLVKSPCTPLKWGISWARIGFQPSGSKESDGSDCPLGGRHGRWVLFFSSFFSSWSLQKDRYKYKKILLHLVAGQCLWGKENFSRCLAPWCI